MKRFLLILITAMLCCTVLIFIQCSHSNNITPTVEPTVVFYATSTPTAVPTSLPTYTPIPSITNTVAFVSSPDCNDISRQPLPKTDVLLTDNIVSVSIVAELALTSKNRQQGLMCRATLPNHTGMLFVFDKPYKGGFWMFNTYIPLDILYISDNGNVIGYASMSPCRRKENESDSIWSSRCSKESVNYRPNGEYIAALEIPQGWLDELGFEISNINVSWNYENSAQE